MTAYQRFAPSLSGNFGYGFLQIHHWPIRDRFIPLRAARVGFFWHPCLRLHVASFQGSWLDLHQLVIDHAGHTAYFVLPTPENSKMVKNKKVNLPHKAEAETDVAVAGVVPVAKSGTTIPGRVVPTAAAKNTDRA